METTMRVTLPALTVAIVSLFAPSIAPEVAMAQTTANTSQGEIRIAPGRPATVGRNGALSGIVPGRAVKVPEGTRTVLGVETTTPRAKEGRAR